VDATYLSKYVAAAQKMFYPVSYTHLRPHDTMSKLRMPHLQ
jgi:hypothetical protein